jgi:hypothetical protein
LATVEQPRKREDVRALLDEIEDALEDLRHSYEKYFCGVDRVAPVRKRERVERRIRELAGLHVTSTALRFRMQGLRARFVTYSHYWNRTLDQIERGVHRRGPMKATPRPQTPRPEPSEAVSEAETPGTVNGLGQDVAALFEQLVEAKRAAGESTDGLTLPALVRKLSRETPKLEQRHGGRPVRFEVATIKGKVRLRARPTRSA